MDGFLILAIETATGCGSVSLTRGGADDFHLVAECTTQPDITHSRRLLGSIEWLMKSSGVHWDDLDAVAVSTGPGSFTGLRIGMAAAKAIAMAADTKLVGVPTLDALACCCGMKNSLLCCLLDARKQQVYAGFYRTDEHGFPVPVAEPMVVDPEQLLAGYDEPVTLAGPGVKVYSDCFLNQQQVAIMPDYNSSPRAMYVGLLAGEKMVQNEILDPLTASPVYVRASEAEVNLQRKQQKRN